MHINQQNKHHAQQHKSRNKTTSLFSYSIFRNFGRICRISLYKGSLGDWWKSGFLLRQAAKPSDELATVLNSTFCYELHSMNTRRWATSQINGSSSGCKVTNKWAKYQIYLSIFERENSNSFAWLVQELRDAVSKVIILFERNKSIHIFLFWACSSFTKQITASFVALARKVRIRQRPSTVTICCT